jgi:hypothetical protein
MQNPSFMILMCLALPFAVRADEPTVAAPATVTAAMEAPVGSRFEEKPCRTFQQLRDESLNGKAYLEPLQRIVPPNRS